MLTCTLDLDFFRGNVARTVNTIQIGVLTASRKAAVEARDWAKYFGKFKDRTGDLRSEIYVSYSSGNANGSTWSVISPKKYSKFVEKGTKPHDIYPKKQAGFIGPNVKGQSTRARGQARSVLRWVVGDSVFFASKVHHPGSKAHPFMTPALFRAEYVLYREMSAICQHVKGMWSV